MATAAEPPMEENANTTAVVRCLHGVADQGPEKQQGFIQVLPAQLGATPHFYGTGNRSSGMSGGHPCHAREMAGESAGWGSPSRYPQDT